jgi:hypothetical protein
MKKTLLALKTVPATSNSPPYCIELAVLENTLLALDPIRRIVPTTKTRITASITAYSAMSCPASSTHNLLINSDMLALQLETSFATRSEKQWTHNAAACCACQTKVFKISTSNASAAKEVPAP